MPQTPALRPANPTRWGAVPSPLLPAFLLIPCAATLLASCAGSAGPEGFGGPEGCVLPAQAESDRSGGSGPRPGSAAFASPDLPRPILVAIEDPVDPAHAPIARTDAEQIVFSQMYETLLRVDCEGRIRPGLAESWSSDGDGRTWTFTLRNDLRDWTGEAVNALDISSGWGRDPVAAVSIVGDRTLRIETAEPVTAATFARPDLAAWNGRNADGWPVGTGPLRPRTGTPASGGPLSFLVAERSPAGPGSQAVEFRAPSGDGRDAIDAGADILVTAEPSVIAYARSSPGLRTVPLAWTRVYVLVSRDAELPSPADSAAGGFARFHWLHPPAISLDALARDAVRRDARGAPQPQPSRCEAPVPPPRFAAGPAPAPRIVYPAADPVARSLAERLVALSSLPDHPDGRWVARALAAPGAVPFRSAGLPGESFAEGLRSGTDAAYVVALERALPFLAEGGPGSGCAILEDLLGRAPWLGGAGTGRGPAVALLVETRNTLVVAAGLAGVEIDGRGGIGLGRARHSAGREP